jgi:hypothetical protein
MRIFTWLGSMADVRAGRLPLVPAPEGLWHKLPRLKWRFRFT